MRAIGLRLVCALCGLVTGVTTAIIFQSIFAPGPAPLLPSSLLMSSGAKPVLAVSGEPPQLHAIPVPRPFTNTLRLVNFAGDDIQADRTMMKEFLWQSWHEQRPGDATLTVCGMDTRIRYDFLVEPDGDGKWRIAISTQYHAFGEADPIVQFPAAYSVERRALQPPEERGRYLEPYERAGGDEYALVLRDRSGARFELVDLNTPGAALGCATGLRGWRERQVGFRCGMRTSGLTIGGSSPALAPFFVLKPP